MTSLHLSAHVDHDGRLILELPADFKDINVEVEVKKEPLWKTITQKEYRARLERLAGSIDDPTFVEPEDFPPEPIEPWD